MFHCFMFFPCVVSWCGFSKGFLSNQCSTQPLSPVRHSKVCDWSGTISLPEVEPSRTVAVLSDEYARFGATNGRPGSLPASSQDFSVPCWQDLAPDFMGPQPASISRLLRAASNFHEQNWHKTYHPFPNFFCFARRSVYVGYLLHSKLLTRKWPSQHSLLRRTESPMQIGRLGRSWTNALLIHVVRYRVQVLLVGMRSRYHKSSRCFTADEVNGAYCLTSC